MLEGQAVDIYTKSIFCDVQAELIGFADCINKRYEDQPDGFVKFYVNDFQQPCTSLFQVNNGVLFFMVFSVNGVLSYAMCSFLF